ncbi:MAG: hypothetical protein SVY15_05445 [Halobacteriota archaeon]|nr:hypothetical protein [Halobacteriota archaeon]
MMGGRDSILFTLGILSLIILGCIGPVIAFEPLPEIVEIPYSGYHEVELTAPKANKTILIVKARIDSVNMKGEDDLMRVMVNGNIVTKTQLINKGPYWSYGDGRRLLYYNPDHMSWNLFYSPDFKSNNEGGSGYRVIGEDAYTYEFDVSKMVEEEEDFKVIIWHSANEWIDDYSPEESSDIKKTRIVVESIDCKGVMATPTPTIIPTILPEDEEDIKKSEEKGLPGFELIYSVAGLLALFVILKKG